MSRLIKFILVGFLVFAMFESYQLMDGNNGSVQAIKEEKVEVTSSSTSSVRASSGSRNVTNVTKKSRFSTMRTPINWRLSSETKDYPNVRQLKNFWVKVSISKNRTYLMDGDQVVYTMYSSAGQYSKNSNGKMVSDTPTGTFYVQQERGNSFYNSELNEGANYWVSWLNHGEYLFHSVPTNSDGSYNETEAKKLGVQPASHGCVRLSVADARWMMENLTVGTKIVVQD